MSFEARMLQPLTLDAVKAKSLAQHMRLGEANTHFNTEVSWLQRIAALTEHATAIFHHGILLPDVFRLQDSLLELSATSATWAEVLDIAACRCPEIGKVCWRHVELKSGGVQ